MDRRGPGGLAALVDLEDQADAAAAIHDPERQPLSWHLNSTAPISKQPEDHPTCYLLFQPKAIQDCRRVSPTYSSFDARPPGAMLKLARAKEVISLAQA